MQEADIYNKETPDKLTPNTVYGFIRIEDVIWYFSHGLDHQEVADRLQLTKADIDVLFSEYFRNI